MQLHFWRVMWIFSQCYTLEATWLSWVHSQRQVQQLTSQFVLVLFLCLMGMLTSLVTLSYTCVSRLTATRETASWLTAENTWTIHFKNFQPRSTVIRESFHYFPLVDKGDASTVQETWLLRKKKKSAFQNLKIVLLFFCCCCWLFLSHLANFNWASKVNGDAPKT